MTTYKINIQKSIAFLYANNNQLENVIENKIPFTMATETINHLRINLKWNLFWAPKDSSKLGNPAT